MRCQSWWHSLGTVHELYQIWVWLRCMVWWRWDNQWAGIHGHGWVSSRMWWDMPAHNWYVLISNSRTFPSIVFAQRCQTRIMTCWTLCSWIKLQRPIPPRSCGANTKLHSKLWWSPFYWGWSTWKVSVVALETFWRATLQGRSRWVLAKSMCDITHGPHGKTYVCIERRAYR